MPAGPPFLDSAVEARFADYSPPVCEKLLTLRRLIFETHASLPEAGTLIETLKWGQPAYLTEKPKTGSTLRIDASGQAGDEISMFFICTTTLVDEFRSQFGTELNLIGNRELQLPAHGNWPFEILQSVVSRTLTYKISR